MIEYDRLIYLDVYRTGSTHVLRRLAEVMGKKPLRFHRHASVTKARPLAFIGRKLTVATVRNPWDWYVSLWAFGAGGNSAIRRYLAATFTEPEVNALYDANEPGLSFRRWLKLVHDPEILTRIMQEHLPQSGLAPMMGLYSYRFLRVATYHPRLMLRRPFVTSAATHLRRFRAFSEAVRTETLDNDLDRLFVRLDLPVKPRPVLQVNASARTLPGYRDYYDDETRDLVASRDGMFTTEFGYEF
jgi:hypothetical protein